MELCKPTPAELRLLRSSANAVALFRALCRARDEAQLDDNGYFLGDLDVLRVRARIRTYQQARLALRALRTAGLVRTERRSVERDLTIRLSRSGRPLPSPVTVKVRSFDHLYYAVVGGASIRSGVVELEFPRRTWEDFVTRADLDGRANARAVSELPSHCRMAVELKAWIAEHATCWSDLHGSQNDSEKLSGSENTSACCYTAAELRSAFSSPKKKAPAAPILPSVEESEEQLTRDLLAMLSTSGPRPTPRPELYEHWPANPGLSIQPDKPELGVIRESYSQTHGCMLVIDGFRKAVREVYGVRWMGYRNADPDKLKTFRDFAVIDRCRAAMVEDQISPEHWAIWRLRWFQKNPRFAKSPPPLRAVMSADKVAKMAGYFRKDYEYPFGATSRLDLVKQEQQERNWEAEMLGEGWSHERAWLRRPVWYVEMRRFEVGEGLTRPHDRWPYREADGTITRGRPERLRGRTK